MSGVGETLTFNFYLIIYNKSDKTNSDWDILI